MNNFFELMQTNQQFAFDIVLLLLAMFRISIEFIPDSTSKLPISQYLNRHMMPNTVENFHRFGLIMASGYLVFGLPYAVLQVMIF
jgi:hypothetical protein